MTETIPPAAELVLRFLASVGKPAEAEQYLSLFRSEHPESFAVIHVSAPVIDHAFDALVVALRFLSDLGLCPIVAFGAVTERGARRAAERVRVALGSDDPAELATIESAAELTRRDIIPLVPLDQSGGDSDDARFDLLSRLVARVNASKVVFVGRRSGLQPKNGAVVSMVDVAREAPELLGLLPEPQRKLLRQITRMFATVGHSFTVSVTSPMDLLRELFTVKGAGTLVRRAAVITKANDWNAIDRERMTALVSTAFAKPLAQRFFEHNLVRAFIADDYRGVAVVTDSPFGPYLSKFAVNTVARGEGIGRDLWRAMNDEFPSIFWKSRSENPITSWYREQCDGLHRLVIAGTPWTILWRGILPSKIPEVIDYCAALPTDFV